MMFAVESRFPDDMQSEVRRMRSMKSLLHGKGRCFEMTEITVTVTYLNL